MDGLDIGTPNWTPPWFRFAPSRRSAPRWQVKVQPSVLTTLLALDDAGAVVGGSRNPQAAWMLIAAIMLIPIVMVVLTLTVTYPLIRLVNIVAPILLILFNIAGLPYKGMYDNFLIVVSFLFNALTIWYAWTWVV